jgi:hypothetical protein
MKIFLSALENGSTCYDSGKPLAHYFVESGIRMKYNLMSYYYVKGNHELAEYIRNHSEEILIDSGAHSFQKGKKVDWVQYTKDYAEFIKKFDRPNVVGYFEMDVDNILGYERVKELRRILESVSDKIIPVWHKNRGIQEYKDMCRQYAGKVVAITGFKNEDIQDHQYMMFLKYAKKYNCKVHCLGMTRKKILDEVPFDYVDSSSWKQSGIYGRIDGKGKVTREFSKVKREVVFRENYLYGMDMQNHYYKKWRNVCKD